MDNRLVGLALVFVPLSLLSFGGAPSIMAEMQHQTVGVHGWLTDQEFVDLFAIARAAPGPGSLIVVLIGWKAAGWLGVLVTTLAFYIPTSLLVYGAGMLWQRYRASPWWGAVEQGLAPIAVGLVLAGSVSVLEASHVGILELATAAASTGLLLTRRAISPYALIGAVAALYIALEVIF
jgi:chromate transporter